MEPENKTQSVDYSELVADIQNVVSKLSSIIDEYPNLKDKNFGLFYQHGRIGFMDLDAFAESTKARINEGDEEKTLTEVAKDIDKSEE